MEMPVSLETLLHLATALGIGLLVGAERSWRERDEEESRQSAGIRTFSLTGFLGGLSTLLSASLGVTVWAMTLAALALVITAAYFGDLRRTGDQGITSEIALLATFMLGSLALAGHPLLAAGAGVVVALLLSLKESLHNALKKLSASELSGAFKLLFISLVLLPVLPNQGYGPWQVFNPYTTWWMVVLIAALGFVAYVAIKLVGTRHGLMLTAVLGSLVSSTAMTMTLARLGSQHALHSLLAAGLLATSALMFPRVLLEVGLVNPGLLPGLLWPLGLTTLVYLSGALWFWYRAGQEQATSTEAPLKNPFELHPAIRFALLLALILFLVEAARRYLGDTGVYLVALLAGLTDVDAITLSLSRSAHQDLAPQVATWGIIIAVFSNSLVKAVLIASIGGRALVVRTFPIMAAGLLAGVLAMLL